MGSRWGNYQEQSRPQIEMIYLFVEQNPGVRQADIARALGIRRETISRRMPALEHFKFLLYEDDERRLYPFVIEHWLGYK
jgi:Mn-dependent DtxR family transcriptional regulator